MHSSLDSGISSADRECLPDMLPVGMKKGLQAHPPTTLVPYEALNPESPTALNQGPPSIHRNPQDSGWPRANNDVSLG